jgi:hypothetical protein
MPRQISKDLKEFETREQKREMGFEGGSPGWRAACARRISNHCEPEIMTQNEPGKRKALQLEEGQCWVEDCT